MQKRGDNMDNCSLIRNNALKFEYPKWVVFQLLEKCNLRCKMCYEWGKEGSYFGKKELAQLDINVVKKVIEECSHAKPYFELFGGEPLMYPQVDEVLAFIQHHGCYVDIPTNGTLLEKYADMLVEYEPRRIWISIDGPERINDIQRGKGVYKIATAGIKSLYEARESKGKKHPMIGVTMVVTPLNYRYIEELFMNDLDTDMIDWVSMEFQLFTTKNNFDLHAHLMEREFHVQDVSCARGLLADIHEFQEIDIKELIRQVNRVRDFCKNKGIQVIGYPKTMDEGNIYHFYQGEWDKMIDKRSKCSFPWIYMEISATGDVTPCHTFYDYNVGNVNRESILDIWRGEKMEKFRNYTKKNLLPICTACSRYYSDL